MGIGKKLREIWNNATRAIAAPDNTMGMKQLRHIQRKVSDATGFAVYGESYSPMVFGRYGGMPQVVNTLNDIRRNVGLVIPKNTDQVKIDKGIEVFVAAAKEAGLDIQPENVCLYEKQQNAVQRRAPKP